MNKEQPSYYAIIPAKIRYDKDIPPMAKLIYGELTALSNKAGYCWALNSYFTELYDLTDVSISRLLKKLESKGYIQCEYDYSQGNKCRRKIYLCKSLNKNVPTQKCCGSLNKNDKASLNKNVKHNNTRVNNTRKNSITVGADAPKQAKFCPPTLEEVKAYIQEKGYKVDAEKWWNYYDSKDWYIGKNKMVKWKSAVATWNTRNYDEERKIKLEAQKAYIADVEMKKQKNKNNLEKTHEMFQKAEKFMEFLGGKSDKSRSRAIDNYNQSLLPDKKDTG